MNAHRTQRLVSLGALVVGLVLFAVTVYFFDFTQAFAAGRRMAVAIALALLATGAAHLIRTWAWAWCFAHPRAVPFARLVRVRLAGEALSYLTISSLAGDPLKVVLLGDRVAARDASAAVALERIFFIVGTAFIVGIGAMVALATQPLAPVWITVYKS